MPAWKKIKKIRGDDKCRMQQRKGDVFDYNGSV